MGLRERIDQNEPTFEITAPRAGSALVDADILYGFPPPLATAKLTVHLQASAIVNVNRIVPKSPETTPGATAKSKLWLWKDMRRASAAFGATGNQS